MKKKTPLLDESSTNQKGNPNAPTTNNIPTEDQILKCRTQVYTDNDDRMRQQTQEQMQKIKALLEKLLMEKKSGAKNTNLQNDNHNEDKKNPHHADINQVRDLLNEYLKLQERFQPANGDPHVPSQRNGQ